jgi:FtsP/CotA-like multicopper oxidase with cupredoxin domain
MAFAEAEKHLSRRRFLALAGGTAAALGVTSRAAAGLSALEQVSASARVSAPLQPGAAATDVALVAQEVTFDLAGRQVTTWGFNGAVPGPLVRLPAGRTLRAVLTNHLAEPTSIHWHGIALANPMDGVPDVTQQAVEPGGTFVYDFVAPDPGTYFFHSHSGLQLDRGLYAPLLVDDASDAGAYDAEWVLTLDDWTDGVGRSPDAIFERLRKMGSMPGGNGDGGGHDMGMDMAVRLQGGGRGDGGMSRSRMLGGMAGDVEYPLYLINGRPSGDPDSLIAQPGQRVRLRIINAGSDTAFRFAVGGHRLTVTHADGFPVEPVEADSLLLGMGERVDALVTCRDGAWPVVARAEGKGAEARAVLRAGVGDAGGAASVRELDRRPLTVAGLSPSSAVALEAREPDRVHHLVLDGDEMRYRWTINGRTFDPADSMSVRQGERVRLEFVNRSTMWHPMHLHGHTFAVFQGDRLGARKDTVVVRPGERMTVDFDATNAGSWAVHCHNAYHQAAGMMSVLVYR